MLLHITKAAAWNYSRAAIDFGAAAFRAKFVSPDFASGHYFWATMGVIASVGLVTEGVLLAFHAAKPAVTRRLQRRILEAARKPIKPFCHRGLWSYMAAGFNTLVTISRTHSLLPDIAKRLYWWVTAGVTATTIQAAEAVVAFSLATMPGFTHRLERHAIADVKRVWRTCATRPERFCVLKLS